MTIEKGQEWARPVPSGFETVVVASDAALADLVFAQIEAGEQAGSGSEPFLVTPKTGDLLVTLGLERPRGEDALAYSMDLVIVTLDEDRRSPMASHLVVPPGLSRPSVAALNASWWKGYRLAPKAHPNDGLVDVVSGKLPLGQWREARRRAQTGSHLPHPALTVERVSSWFYDFGRPVPLSVDHRRIGRSRTIGLTVVADAFTLVA